MLRFGNQVSSKQPSAAPIKRVQAPNGKSTGAADVAIPELNQKFVNMFNSQNSSPTPNAKAVPKVQSASNNIRPSFNAKNASFNKPPVSNYAKVSPVPSSSQPTSAPREPPAWKKALADKKLSDNSVNNANKKPAPAKLASSNQFVEKKPMSRPASSNQVKKPQAEVRNKIEAAEPKPITKDVSHSRRSNPSKPEAKTPPLNQ